METKKKKIHRFAVRQVPQEGDITITDPDLVHQWKNVLRFAPGEQIVLFAEGIEVHATLKLIDNAGAHLDVTTTMCIDRLDGRGLTLYVSMFKKAPFEWMLEKVTEIGVKTIVPMETQRTVRFPWKRARFETIVKEAAEQCGRSDMPEITEPMTFAAALEHAKENTENFLFDIGEQTFRSASGPRIGGFIGPEGGFTQGEVDTAKKAGFRIVGLGDLALRAETAAIVASYELLKR
jgi:16S rRNA (uracil1498-N3)-methyltransferase